MLGQFHSNISISHATSWRQRLRWHWNRVFVPITNASHIQRLIRNPATITNSTVARLGRSVNLIIEPRCNLTCRDCHYWRSRDRQAGGPDCDFARMLRILDEVPYASVAITGGEPLLSPSRAVEAAKALLHKERKVSLLTNCLALSVGDGAKSAREILAGGLSSSERLRLLVRCSVDTMHQAASDFSISEYAAHCQASIRYLVSHGFRVCTRSLVTTKHDYDFFRDYVRPLAAAGITATATVQPNIYRLREFAGSLHRGELGDISQRMDPGYLAVVLNESRPGSKPGPRTQALRTAPWVLIEVNAQGVRGPSPFVSGSTHHVSVSEMLRSYDWLTVADSAVPQLTITRNAFPYRVDRADRSVALKFSHVLKRAVGR